MFCELCDGDLVVLGSLGRRRVTRCRDCGMTFNETKGPCSATPDGMWCDCPAGDPDCRYDELLNAPVDDRDEFDRHIDAGGTVSGWDMR